jgi:hypothetical protein
VGALIDEIAASGHMSSYTRPAQGDEPITALRAANALALDLTEDLRDLGLDIYVLWEGDWVMLSSAVGGDFSFIAKSPDAFELDDNRKGAVSRGKLLSGIVKWVATVQRKSHLRKGQPKGPRM